MNSRSCDVMRSAPSSDARNCFEPDDRFDVEVVGRLVHQQNVRASEQHARHRDAHLPAARQRAHVSVDPLLVEAEAVQHFARLRFKRVSAEMVVLLLHFAEAREDAVHVAGLVRIRHVALKPVQLVVEIAERGRCRRSPRRARSGRTSPRRPDGSSRPSASSARTRRRRRAAPRRRSSGTASSSRSRSGRPGRPSRLDSTETRRRRTGSACRTAC